MSTNDSVIDVDLELSQRGEGRGLRRVLRRGAPAAVGCVVAMVLGAGTAVAGPLRQVTELQVPATVHGPPLEIAARPDGNLWFTEDGNARIGRIGAGSLTPVMSVYATNGVDRDAFEYTVSTAGALTAVGRIAAGTTPAGVAVSPDGGSVYVANGGGTASRSTR